MLVPQGNGSGTPTKPYHTPSPEAQQTLPTTHSSPSLPPILTLPLPTVIPTDTPSLRQYTRRTKIAQSLVLPPVADEHASPLGDDSQGEACPTDSGFKADQDKANIAKTSTLPSDSTPRVTSLAADEGRLQNNMEMMPPIKGRRLDEREEAAERVSDDTEEMETVLTSMDASSILTSGGVQVVPTATISIPTGSGVVSTASLTIPTGAPIFTTATESTPYTRRKGKEKMVESEKPKKKKNIQEQIDIQMARELEKEMARDAQRMSEQIARDEDIEKIHAEEELQRMIDGLDRNNEIEEAERFKRKGLILEQESVKKLKTSEEVKATEEFPEEKVKEMMQLHLDREDLNQLWALVKETLNIRPATSDKEMELWVELKRLHSHCQLWSSYCQKKFPLLVKKVPPAKEKSMLPRPATHKSYRPPMRPIKPNMNVAQPKRTSFYKPSHSYAQRPFQGKSADRTQFRAPRVSTVCCCCSRQVNTARPKAVINRRN
nr:hypothetical protein [Tanacetum cinerariifolium]